MKTSLLNAAAAILAVAAGVLPAAAQQGGNFEAAPQFSGTELAPPALLKGPLHAVREPIALDGFLGRFGIESKYGMFSVAGVAMLSVRVSELAAIEELGKVDRSQAFQDALVKSAKAPVRFVGNLVTDPGKTVESVAAGAGTVLGRIGRLVTTGAARVADEASDATTSQKKPPSKAAPTGEPEPPSFTGDPFGYNKARREWAKKLNIDPYTTNPVLGAKLDEVATATFSGGFAIDTAIGIVAAPLRYGTEFEGTVRDSVWNVPVIDLEAQNEAKLKAMKIDGRVVRDLFRNKWFTPTLQTALVGVLQQFEGVRGRESVVQTAATVQGETRARFLVRSLRMLAEDHRKGARLTEIAMSGLVPIGRAGGGDIIVAADLDYLWWNEQVAEFMQRSEVSAGKRTLLISGKTSNRVAQELGRRGWNLKKMGPV